jgi:hypothetical protein
MPDKAPFGTVTNCSSCGGRILAAADVCPKCGVRQHGFPPPGAGSLTYTPPTPSTAIAASDAWPSEKRILPTLLFCVLLGVFGAHRFYVGRVVSGVVQLLTLGGLGIWWLIDLILLLTESFRDAEGRRLQEWM